MGSKHHHHNYEYWFTPEGMEDIKERIRQAKEQFMPRYKFCDELGITNHYFSEICEAIGDKELTTFPRSLPHHLRNPHRDKKSKPGPKPGRLAQMLDSHKTVDEEARSRYAAEAIEGWKAKYEARRPNYQAVPLIPEVAEPAPTTKPVFCLIVAFDSKEAALKAMGEHI